MLILIILLSFWAFSTGYAWYMCNDLIDEEANWWQIIGLVIVTIVFGPFITIACIGTKLIHTIMQCDIIEQEYQFNIAVVQFGESSNPAILQLSSHLTALGIKWYYFDETADRELELKDLREHYKLIFEYKGE